VCALLGDNQGARDAYAEAARISGNVPRYLACLAEAELRLRHDAEAQNGYEDLLAVLCGSDPETLSIRSRLLAAAGKTAEALAVARSIGGYEGLAAEAIIHTMHSASQQAIDACDAGLAQPNLPETTRQLFLILRARGRFRLALRPWFATDGGSVLPLSGPADADIEQLRAAWPDIETAALSLRRSGWPMNIEFLADVWSSTAAILGEQDQTLPLLAEAATARPHLAAVQGALESLAVQCGDLRIALIANNRQPPSATRTLRRVALLHMDKQHTASVELMHSVAPSLPTSDPMYAPVLAMAALSADQVVRTNLADSWAEELSRNASWAAEAALLAYFRSISRTPLYKDEALQTLVERFESLGCPVSIALNILHELDPGKGRDAEACVRIANALQRERLLPIDSALRLGHALATLQKWPELRQMTQSCCERFEGSARFIVLEALALDKMGYTPDALSSLQALISSAEVDPLAIDTYINIAVRCGMTHDAIASIESILSGETRPSKRLECLRLLFGLLHQSNPRDPRCIDVAWRIGEHASPDKEEEEGLFLVTMLAATLHAQVDPSDPRIPPFQQRLQEFTTRFPESKILKYATFPENASGDEMLAVLRQISGTTKEQARWRQRVETQMQRGDLLIPYAWRPRICIDVPDVPTLWELTKHSRSDRSNCI
jgi:tetratricopeptide (TPR) repeat protein